MKYLLILSLLLAGCRSTQDARMPHLRDVWPETEKIRDDIYRIEYLDVSVAHDSGPFAVFYRKGSKSWNPFDYVEVGDTYTKVQEVAGSAFHEWAGGSDEVWYRYAFGSVILHVNDQGIIYRIERHYRP
jgi:hypothetical protein